MTLQRRSAYDWTVGLGGALIRIGGGLLVIAMAVAGTYFVIRVGDILAIGLERWAHGEPLDMQGLGGLALVIGAICTGIATIVPVIVASGRDRRLREIEHMRQGGAPPNPTPPSPGSSPAAAPAGSPAGPSPSGGLINNDAIS